MNILTRAITIENNSIQENILSVGDAAKKEKYILSREAFEQVLKIVNK